MSAELNATNSVTQGNSNKTSPFSLGVPDAS
jgi:hypothetical protein